MKFDDVIDILDRSGGGPDADVSSHGPFSRGVTRDRFVEMKVGGRKPQVARRRRQLQSGEVAARCRPIRLRPRTGAGRGQHHADARLPRPDLGTGNRSGRGMDRRRLPRVGLIIQRDTPRKREQ